jgi:hypothetical protein
MIMIFTPNLMSGQIQIKKQKRGVIFLIPACK